PRYGVGERRVRWVQERLEPRRPDPAQHRRPDGHAAVGRRGGVGRVVARFGGGYGSDQDGHSPRALLPDRPRGRLRGGWSGPRAGRGAAGREHQVRRQTSGVHSRRQWIGTHGSRWVRSAADQGEGRRPDCDAARELRLQLDRRSRALRLQPERRQVRSRSPAVCHGLATPSTRRGLRGRLLGALGGGDSAAVWLYRVGAPGFEPGTFWSEGNSRRQRVTTQYSIHAVFWA